MSAPAYNLLRLCLQGFHFCERCERIVDLPESTEADARVRCPHCKHFTLIWSPPFLAEGPITDSNPHEEIHPAPQPLGARGV